MTVRDLSVIDAVVDATVQPTPIYALFALMSRTPWCAICEFTAWNEDHSIGCEVDWCTCDRRHDDEEPR